MLEIKDLIKYALEGIAVAVVAFYIPKRKTDINEVLLIAATAAISFLVLDQFAPLVGVGARQGTGFGIGYNMVGGADQNESLAPVFPTKRTSCPSPYTLMPDGACNMPE